MMMCEIDVTNFPQIIMLMYPSKLTLGKCLGVSVAIWLNNLADRICSYTREVQLFVTSS